MLKEVSSLPGYVACVDLLLLEVKDGAIEIRDKRRGGASVQIKGTLACIPDCVLIISLSGVA